MPYCVTSCALVFSLFLFNTKTLHGYLYLARNSTTLHNLGYETEKDTKREREGVQEVGERKSEKVQHSANDSFTTQTVKLTCLMCGLMWAGL